jgi:LysM repeat protein
MNAWPAPRAADRYSESLTALMSPEAIDWAGLHEVWATGLAHLSVSDETGENAGGGDRSGREGLPLSASGTSVLPLSSPPLSLPERKKKGDAPTGTPHRQPLGTRRTHGLAIAGAAVVIGTALMTGAGAATTATRRTTTATPPVTPAPTTTTSTPLAAQYKVTAGDAWYVTHNDITPPNPPVRNEVTVPIVAAWDSVIHPVRPVPPSPPAPADITTGEAK